MLHRVRFHTLPRLSRSSEKIQCFHYFSRIWYYLIIHGTKYYRLGTRSPFLPVVIGIEVGAAEPTSVRGIVVHTNVLNHWRSCLRIEGKRCVLRCLWCRCLLFDNFSCLRALQMQRTRVPPNKSFEYNATHIAVYKHVVAGKNVKSDFDPAYQIALQFNIVNLTYLFYATSCCLRRFIDFSKRLAPVGLCTRSLSSILRPPCRHLVRQIRIAVVCQSFPMPILHQLTLSDIYESYTRQIPRINYLCESYAS